MTLPEAEAAREVVGWKAKDTAPKDGRAILGCMPGPVIDIVWYDKELQSFRDYYYKQKVDLYFGWQELPLPPDGKSTSEVNNRPPAPLPDWQSLENHEEDKKLDELFAAGARGELKITYSLAEKS